MKTRASLLRPTLAGVFLVALAACPGVLLSAGALTAGEPAAKDPPPAFFLITPHYGYRDPSEGDLRWQVCTALAYGCKGLCYYSYAPACGGEGIVDKDFKPTKRYALARKINAELNVLGPLLATLKSTAVYHTSAKPPKGTRGPGADAKIRKTEGGVLVVGELQGPDGRCYLFLSNPSPKEECKARATLADGVKVVREVPRGPGAPDKPAVEGRQMSVALAPGDGRIFEIELPRSEETPSR